MVAPKSTDLRRRRGPWLALGAAGLAQAAALAYEDGAPPAYTGGFGEEDCTACHADNAMNDARGRLRIEAVAPASATDRTYRIRIVLEHPELKSGGFQASIRTGAGRPAGRIVRTSDRTTVVETDGRTYVQHSANGRESRRVGTIDWSFAWVAPPGDEPIVVHVAANASNDDLSALGDFIFTASEELGARRPTN